MPPEAIDLRAEWLEADGCGGFASGTVGGERTRRYHALLLTATTPPTGRVVLVNGQESWIEAGEDRYALTAQRYLPDVAVPGGQTFLTSFAATPWPCWTYTLPGGIRVAHDILVQPSSCVTILRWRYQAGPRAIRLGVRLLLSGRDYHALHHENAGFCFDARISNGNAGWRPYASLPAVSALSNGTYLHRPEWYRNFLYTEERDRGLDDTEDLASPGMFLFDLETGGEAVIVLREGDGLSGDAAPFADWLTGAEAARRAALPGLRRAAGSYRVARPGGETLVAGFPWFTDWGRDTFIAMRGLVLTLGNHAAAERILLAWAATVSEGMLPNRFPDSGASPEYNAVDASLWFIVAVHEFLAGCETARDPLKPATTQTLRTACEAILHGYTAGTRFGIRADVDGFLRAGVPGVQLTWMDAKTGDHVVTPRTGKPVEVQALWYNALRIGGLHWSAEWAAAADRVHAAFAGRFAGTGGALVDVADNGHVPGADDASIRPNQIFAVGGLPFPLLEGAAGRAVVDRVERELLTPMGLRSLSPNDAAYAGRYCGGPAQRDGAYHQGTVWPWLIGPFVDAWLSVRGRDAAAKGEAAERFLAPLMAHLGQAGLGHVSEVADGDAPHKPGGCPFQAWSLGELIRVRAMLGLAV